VVSEHSINFRVSVCGPLKPSCSPLSGKEGSQKVSNRPPRFHFPQAARVSMELFPGTFAFRNQQTLVFESMEGRMRR
jgi:hypothetical protein